MALKVSLKPRAKIENAQIGTNCGFILIAKPFVDVLVHERRLSDAVRLRHEGTEGLL